MICDPIQSLKGLNVISPRAARVKKQMILVNSEGVEYDKMRVKISDSM
jgi:hypothetical protein